MLKVKRIYQIKERKVWWICECSCGNTVAVRADDLKWGIEDCGCISDNDSYVIMIKKSAAMKAALSDMQNEERTSSINTITLDEVFKKSNLFEENSENVEDSKDMKDEKVGVSEMDTAVKSEKVDNMIGQKFGFLTVLEYVGIRSNLKTYRCKCDCGNEVDVAGSLLRRGKKDNCGCKTGERMTEAYKRRKRREKGKDNNTEVKENNTEDIEDITSTVFNYIAKSVNISDIETELTEDSCKLVIKDKEVIKKLAAVEAISKLKESGVINDNTFSSWIKDLLK